MPGTLWKPMFVAVATGGPLLAWATPMECNSEPSDEMMCNAETISRSIFDEDFEGACTQEDHVCISYEGPMADEMSGMVFEVKAAGGCIPKDEVDQATIESAKEGFVLKTCSTIEVGSPCASCIDYTLVPALVCNGPADTMTMESPTCSADGTTAAMDCNALQHSCVSTTARFLDDVTGEWMSITRSMGCMNSTDIDDMVAENIEDLIVSTCITDGCNTCFNSEVVVEEDGDEPTTSASEGPEETDTAEGEVPSPVEDANADKETGTGGKSNGGDADKETGTGGKSNGGDTDKETGTGIDTDKETGTGGKSNGGDADKETGTAGGKSNGGDADKETASAAETPESTQKSGSAEPCSSAAEALLPHGLAAVTAAGATIMVAMLE